MEFLKLKECLDRFVNDYNTPGVDCIVYREHQPIFRYFAGVRDLETGKKIDGDELYFIFSMTKMLTCTCALQLFEKGAYKMDDPISIYLPEFEKMKVSVKKLVTDNANKIATGEMTGEPVYEKITVDAENPITVKDLFTMQGGLDYAISAPYITEAIEKGKRSTRDLVGAMANTVLGFEAGTRYRYSLCHDVLGALIEVWSGMKLGEYMKKNLFLPLGMKDTAFARTIEDERLSRMATRYQYDENKVPQKCSLTCAYTLSDEYESGGAGLVSSTADYALFLDALANGGVGSSGCRILKEETVKMMGTNQLSGKSAEDFYKMRPGYGYGLGVRVHMNPDVSGSLSPVGEFGWDGAAGAFSLVDMKNKISLTYFQHIHSWDLKIQSELKNALYTDIDNG
ncbi:MAG: beta-lactamase family protein [Clostridia bacterium]|nr:beta-lactamase family protein [Clostridia bacterium]